MHSYGHILHKAKEYADSLWTCSFNHVYRECNVVAYAIARHAHSLASYNVLPEETPSIIVQLVQKDQFDFAMK